MNIIFSTITWGLIVAVSGNINDSLLLVTTAVIFCIG